MLEALEKSLSILEESPVGDTLSSAVTLATFGFYFFLAIVRNNG
jgi:hypothetical protein